MKRVLVVLALLTCGALFVPAARAATVPHRLASIRTHRSAALLPAPLAVASATTYPIGGTVKDFSGQPLAGWGVDWGWFDPSGATWSFTDTVYHYGASATTATDGTFSFPAVTSDPLHDYLTAYGDTFVLEQWGLDFSTTSDYVLQPGHVAVTLTNAPASQVFGLKLGDAAGTLAESQPRLTAGSGTADAAAPDFNSAVAFTSSWYGALTAEAEWDNPGHPTVAVTPGQLAGTAVPIDWSTAVHGHLTGALCQHAARPGGTVRFAVSNLPAGEQMSFYGFSWWPADWGVQTYPAATITSKGSAKTYVVSLRIPARATVGDMYEIDATRTDDPQSLLDLYDLTQICTFGASRSSIARGGVVRLTGRTDTGPYSTVTLFARHSRAGVPSSAAAKGWAKVATLRLDSKGRFHSARLHPRRTTWYVARFSDSDSGFTVFTPVVRVAVH